MRNKQDIAVLIFSSVQLRVINKKTQSYTEEISRRDTELIVIYFVFLNKGSSLQDFRQACVKSVFMRNINYQYLQYK